MYIASKTDKNSNTAFVYTNVHVHELRYISGCLYMCVPTYMHHCNIQGHNLVLIIVACKVSCKSTS